MSGIRKFLVSEDGTTSVEYGVMLALVLVAVIGSVSMFGGSAGAMMGNSSSKLKAAGLGGS